MNEKKRAPLFGPIDMELSYRIKKFVENVVIFICWSILISISSILIGTSAGLGYLFFKIISNRI